MKPSTCSNSLYPKLHTFFGTALLLVSLTFFAIPALGSSGGQVVVRSNVSASKKNELASKLRAITGWSTLDFDLDGVLRLGTRNASKGSQSARDLLTRAVNSESFIVIEDASSRSDVAFCRVVGAELYREDNDTLPGFVILIDFADFPRLMGDKRARDAFDVGWGLLHELDHVVENSEDSRTRSKVGDCEDHINEMRQQIGLPIRMEYFFSALPIEASPSLVSKFVRLRFEQRARPNETKHYWLIWDAALVGGLPQEAQTASIRYSKAFTQ